MDKNTETDLQKKAVPLSKKLIPLIMVVLTVALDQITKALVVKNIPQLTIFSDADECVIPVLGDFLRLIHVRNNAVAFSIGSGLSHSLRTILFAFAPLILLIAVLIIYFRNNEFTGLQRWAICGIVGGGFGNLIDRFFRREGVVDFIDCYFPLFFENKRWPTFNVADSVIVVSGIILIISFIAVEVKSRKNKDV